jgi:hypothetical protein
VFARQRGTHNLACRCGVAGGLTVAVRRHRALSTHGSLDGAPSNGTSSFHHPTPTAATGYSTARLQHFTTQLPSVRASSPCPVPHSIRGTRPSQLYGVGPPLTVNSKRRRKQGDLSTVRPDGPATAVSGAMFPQSPECRHAPLPHTTVRAARTLSLYRVGSLHWRNHWELYEQEETGRPLTVNSKNSKRRKKQGDLSTVRPVSAVTSLTVCSPSHLHAATSLLLTRVHCARLGVSHFH